ncbi:MAG: hypothetical protein ACKOXP_04140 [Flavobacteriales bacterium]
MKSIGFILLSSLLILSACHEKDEKFCSCMSKSKEVNALTEKIWSQKGTKADSLTLKKRLKEKRNLCEPYEYKNGEELMQLKAACE